LDITFSADYSLVLLLKASITLPKLPTPIVLSMVKSSRLGLSYGLIYALSFSSMFEIMVLSGEAVLSPDSRLIIVLDILLLLELKLPYG